MPLPDFLRYFIRDAIEGVLAVLGGANILAFFDPSMSDTNVLVHSIVIGAIAAVIAAARRNAGRFTAYLNQLLGTEPSA